MRVKRGLAALGGAVAVAVLSASPALAVGPYIGSNSGGANVRSCANTGCAALAYLGNGTAVTMLCWTDTQWVYPPSSDYASPRWFKITRNGVTGYTHSSLVENQSSVPRC